jgi:hypothetical protein
MPGSRARIYDAAMGTLGAMRLPLKPTRGHPLGFGFAIAMAMATPVAGLAAEPGHCLSSDEQRAAIAGGKAVPLGSVIHALHRAPREVVRARLCQEPDRLIYQLTLLGRDGKVKVATVDATSGAVVGER